MRGKVLSDVAEKRLEATREFTEFGAGFKIALRDMEIRGAGNLLGAQQHGHMEAVGYDMYLKLLSEAVSEEKGDAPSVREEECLIDLPVSADIPDSYIRSNAQRLEIYRRIADIRTMEDQLDVYDELIDRFGEPPAAVQGLVEVALMRNMAADLGIREVRQQGNSLILYQKKLDLELGGRLSCRTARPRHGQRGAKALYRHPHPCGTDQPRRAARGAGGCHAACVRGRARFGIIILSPLCDRTNVRPHIFLPFSPSRNLQTLFSDTVREIYRAPF